MAGTSAQSSPSPPPRDPGISVCCTRLREHTHAKRYESRVFETIKKPLLPQPPYTACGRAASSRGGVVRIPLGLSGCWRKYIHSIEMDLQSSHIHFNSQANLVLISNWMRSYSLPRMLPSSRTCPVRNDSSFAYLYSSKSQPINF